MEHNFLPLATTTLLFFLLFLSTTANGDNFVYDTAGHPLVAGGEYYVIPLDYNPKEGGFTWSKVWRFLPPCYELNVIQTNDNTNYGEPTSFYPVGTKKKKITLSTHVNVVFPEASPPSNLPLLCYPSSNIWKVVRDHVIELGGCKGDNRNSLFAIEDHEEGGYQINYCPNKNTKVGCGALGIAIKDDGQRRLVVNDTKPLAVVFSPEPIVDSKYGGKYAAA